MARDIKHLDGMWHTKYIKGLWTKEAIDKHVEARIKMNNEIYYKSK